MGNFDVKDEVLNLEALIQCLKNKGIITDAEFMRAKDEVLEKILIEKFK